MSKRILHITFGPDLGGEQMQLRLLAQGLPRDEFEAHVCALGGLFQFSRAPRGQRPGTVAQRWSALVGRGRRKWDCPLPGALSDAAIPSAAIRTRSIPTRWNLDAGAFWRLKSHVAGLRPDVIHAWSFAASLYGFSAARACGLAKFIVTAADVDRRHNGLERALEGVVARRSSRVVVGSRAVADYYVRHGMPPERLEIIPNGVARPEPPSTTRLQLLDALRLPEDSRLVALVGHLDFHSRAKIAIWAIDLLKVIRDDVHLLVIGDGPRRDVFRRFSQLCRNRDKVHFLGGRCDAAQILPHCDVFWSTSDCQGRTGGILEAMAAGLPVVAADIPGTREIIVPGTTGYLGPLGDRAAFARHTERLLNDESLRHRIGAAARERALTEYSVEALLARYAALYADVAG